MICPYPACRVSKVGTRGTAARDDTVFFRLAVIHEYARSWTPLVIQGFHACIKCFFIICGHAAGANILEREHQLTVVLLYIYIETF